jgi:hypothetical protein
MPWPRNQSTGPGGGLSTGPGGACLLDQVGACQPGLVVGCARVPVEVYQLGLAAGFRLVLVVAFRLVPAVECLRVQFRT